MSDDDLHESPTGDDARDEHLGALLTVAPLDDVTRRRLVRTALDATEPAPARGRLVAALAVAAALVIGALAGVALVTRPDDSSTTTAARAPGSSTQPRAATPNAPSIGPAARSATPPVTFLGDLGDVGSASRLRTAVENAFGRGLETAGDASALPCVTTSPATLGVVAASAAGTATSGGEPATVVVGTAPGGERLAVVLRTSDCAVLTRVRLPGT